MELMLSSSILTMTSREVAEVTGKDVSNVHRDIRAMLDDLKDDSDLNHVREDKDDRGYTTCFYLPKSLTLTLVTGYSVKLRKALVDRWQTLETLAAAQARAIAAGEKRGQALLSGESLESDIAVVDHAAERLDLPFATKLLMLRGALAKHDKAHLDPVQHCAPAICKAPRMPEDFWPRVAGIDWVPCIRSWVGTHEFGELGPFATKAEATAAVNAAREAERIEKANEKARAKINKKLAAETEKAAEALRALRT